VKFKYRAIPNYTFCHGIQQLGQNCISESIVIILPIFMVAKMISNRQTKDKQTQQTLCLKASITGFGEELY